MKVYKEAKLLDGRIDYLVRLDVGVEVKSLAEITSSINRVVEQVSRYAQLLDAIILLLDIRNPSDIALQYIKNLERRLPDNIIVAYGNPFNVLTWKALKDPLFLNVITKLMSRRNGT
jgi:malate/lactate dehydrogenase